MQPARLALCALLAATLTGCETLHYYDGHKRSERELGQVFVHTVDNLPISVGAINGKPEWFAYKKRLYLIPGDYAFTLRSQNYVRTDIRDNHMYQGEFELKFPVKPGKLYLFKSTQPEAHKMDNQSELCVYEENQESPYSLSNMVGEYRRVGKDAVKLLCDTVHIKQID